MAERYDLAGQRGDRIAVPEHADLDLDSVEELLDQDLVVVHEREVDADAELRLRVGLRDTHRRAEPRGFHEDRVPERILDLVAGAKRDTARDANAALPEHALEQILIHAERRGSNACADVRDARELEQALHGAVLAEGPVQDRQDDVDRAERRGCVLRRDGQGLGNG